MNLFNFVPSKNADAVRQSVASTYQIIDVHGSRIYDEKSFFEEVNKSFLEERGLSCRGWPAFDDNLWEFISGSEGTKWAFFWWEADRLALTDMFVFLTAVDAIISTSRTLYNSKCPKHLILFLAGSHPSFNTGTDLLPK